MSATALRSKLLTKTDIAKVLGLLNTPHRCFKTNLGFDRSGTLEDSPVTTHPLPVENFNACTAVGFDIVGPMRKGKLIAADLESIRLRVQHARASGFDVCQSILLDDASDWMPYLVRWPSHAKPDECKLVLSLAGVNCDLDQSKHTHEHRAQLITDYFSAVGEAFKIKLGKFIFEDGYLKYKGKSDRLSVDWDLEPENAAVNFRFSENELTVLNEALGKYWHQLGISARTVVINALEVDKFNEWCESIDHPAAYYRLDFPAELKRAIFAAVKTIKKNQFSTDTLSFAGFVPIFEIKLSNEDGDHVGFASVSVYVKDRKGYVYVGGTESTSHEAILALLENAKVGKYFQGGNSISLE